MYKYEYECQGPCFASWSAEYVRLNGGLEKVQEAHQALSKKENREKHIVTQIRGEVCLACGSAVLEGKHLRDLPPCN